MLDNGFDMSSFKSNLVDVATDAAVEAVDTINKTVESKTKTKKIDNTKKSKPFKKNQLRKKQNMKNLIIKEMKLQNNVLKKNLNQLIKLLMMNLKN